jgi:hypothetical protein
MSGAGKKEAREVLKVLRRRWPEVAVKSLADGTPRVAMDVADAADLARCRRGVEPLRQVILPQRVRQPATSPTIDPMPVVI